MLKNNIYLKFYNTYIINITNGNIVEKKKFKKKPHFQKFISKL